MRAPFLVEIARASVSIVENPYLNVIVCSNITYLVFLAIFALFIKAIPFQKIERVANVQFVVLLMMSFSAMYLRSSLGALYNKGGSDASLILSYVLILLAFCMLSLCLFERYLASQQERLHATARSISNEYRLRSIEQQNNSNLPATGNSLLNGLLSQKIDKARHDHIRFSADLNAAPLCFISVFDLCAIFGNAIDNSVEACRKIADPTRTSQADSLPDA